MTKTNRYRSQLSSNARRFLTCGAIKGIQLQRVTRLIALGLFESYEIVGCVYLNEEGKYKRRI